MMLPLDSAPAHRVLGLDLSLTATGICHPDGTTTTVKGTAADGDRRLLRIARAIEDALDRQRPRLVVIEDLPTHAKGAGITGMVHGAVRTLLLDELIPYALIPAATLKAFATGKGNASKPDMAVAAFERAGRKFSDDNQCDAWWCHIAGLTRLGAAPFTLPATQTTRLAKVAWPAALVTAEEPMRA